MKRKKGYLLFVLAMTLGLFCVNPKMALASASSKQDIVVIDEDIMNGTTKVYEMSGTISYNATQIEVTSTDDFKKELEKAIVNGDSTASIKYNGTTAVEDVKSFITAAVKEVLQKEGNDYQKALLSKWTVSCADTKPTFTAAFTFNYYETKEQTAEVDKKVDEILASIIKTGMTEEQKEKAIHDYILNNVAYDKSLKVHSAYGALFGNQTTVCQGYALLTYKMLTKAGFSARIITGDANGPHAWNMVKVGGDWYHLDCTFDDPLPDVPGKLYYNYFNLNDDQIASVRKYDKVYYPKAEVRYTPTDEQIKAGYAEILTDAPTDVTVNNNYKISDSVVVKGLTAGDVVKVYSANTEGKTLGYTTVATGKTEAKITIKQLGATSGTVYVSVKTKRKLESERKGFTYKEEPTTDKPDASTIKIVNNYKLKDTVTVPATPGAIVVLYKDATTTKAMGTAKVSKGKSEVTISVKQLGLEKGSIFVTVTETGKRVSARTEVPFDPEGATEKLSADSITVTNNITGKTDVVTVKGLTAGDKVKVYNQATEGKQLGKTITVKKGKTEAIVNISQVGVDKGTIYVSLTKVGKKESERVGKDFDGESKTIITEDIKIAVDNKFNISDTVTVTGLKPGDIVKVYKDATTTKCLATATVKKDKDGVVITIKKLSTDNKIFITVTKAGFNPSDRKEVTYQEEQATDGLSADNITVTNNITGKKDIVTVKGLTAGDKIKVYDQKTEGKQLGKTATVAKGKEEVSITISQVGVSGGAIYVSITKSGKKESNRVEKTFSQEDTTVITSDMKIAVNNYYKTTDKLYVSGLVTGDIVRVYRDGTAKKYYVSGKVGKDKTDITLSLSKLAAEGGSIYITITQTGKNPSARKEIFYDKEQQTTKLSADNITITSSGSYDIVVVNGLADGAKVKIYDQASDGKQLGSTATVAKGKGSVSIKVTHSSVKSGIIYVTVTNTGFMESERQEKAIATAPVEPAPSEPVVGVSMA